MDKLINILGPAPSERSFIDLQALLRTEQKRMSELFEQMAPKKKAAKPKKAKTKRKSQKKTLTKAELAEIERITGMSFNL